MHHSAPNPIPATQTPALCAFAVMAVLFIVAGVSRANLILDGSFERSGLPPDESVPGLSLPWLGSPGSAADVPAGRPAIRLPSDRYPILALADDAGRLGILENGPVAPGGSGFQFLDLKALQDPAATVDASLRLAATIIAPVTQAGIFAATGSQHSGGEGAQRSAVVGRTTRRQRTRSLSRAVAQVSSTAMSILSEVELAAEALPAPQIEHIAARLQREQAAKARKLTNLIAFSGVLRLAEDPLAWQQKFRAEWS